MSSIVDQALADKVEELGKRNAYLESQNKRLSQLLAGCLDDLRGFRQTAEDRTRHYSLALGRLGKHDWRKLLDR